MSDHGGSSRPLLTHVVSWIPATWHWRSYFEDFTVPNSQRASQNPLRVNRHMAMRYVPKLSPVSASLYWWIERGNVTSGLPLKETSTNANGLDDVLIGSARTIMSPISSRQWPSVTLFDVSPIQTCRNANVHTTHCAERGIAAQAGCASEMR